MKRHPPDKRLLSLGAYDVPDQRFARERARARFLFRVNEVKPEVLKELNDVGATAEGVRLLEWARKWHLNDDWILAIARHTLDRWVTWPPDGPRATAADGLARPPRTRRWNLDGTIDLPTLDETVVSLPSPEPDVETKGAYLARGRARLEAAWRAATDAARKTGAKPGKRLDDRHVDWLARFQMGEGYAAIARDASQHENTVRDAVERLATFLVLTRRPLRAGRPRKTT